MSWYDSWFSSDGSNKYVERDDAYSKYGKFKPGYSVGLEDYMPAQDTKYGNDFLKSEIASAKANNPIGLETSQVISPNVMQSGLTNIGGLEITDITKLPKNVAMPEVIATTPSGPIYTGIDKVSGEMAQTPYLENLEAGSVNSVVQDGNLYAGNEQGWVATDGLGKAQYGQGPSDTGKSWTGSDIASLGGLALNTYNAIWGPQAKLAAEQLKTLKQQRDANAYKLAETKTARENMKKGLSASSLGK